MSVRSVVGMLQVITQGIVLEMSIPAEQLSRKVGNNLSDDLCGFMWAIAGLCAHLFSKQDGSSVHPYNDHIADHIHLESQLETNTVS